jgi:hypothetical protein
MSIVALMLVLFGAGIWCLVELARNERVFRFRGELLAAIHQAIEQDFAHGLYFNWQWRYTAFDAVSYDDMVRQFWRPMESFYPDRRFIEATVLADGDSGDENTA